MTNISTSAAAAIELPDTAPLSAADEGAAQLAAALNARWQQASAEEILRDTVETVTPGRLAVVSSFGADAAVLLHLVAETDRTLPILFIDTGKHFTETLMYRDILVGRFGFTDARALEPIAEEVKRLDPK